MCGSYDEAVKWADKLVQSQFGRAAPPIDFSKR